MGLELLTVGMKSIFVENELKPRHKFLNLVQETKKSYLQVVF